MKMIAFVGFKDAGKSTAAIPLIGQGHVPISFADALKDCLASIFCWPRPMLEGDTPESRAWREQADPFWAAKLDIPGFTPRMAMQRFGTDIMRNHFNPNIWVYAIERRLSLLPPDRNAVLTDCRYPNEIAVARTYGGEVYRIRKGEEPDWYQVARDANLDGNQHLRDILQTTYGVHESEYAWIGSDLDGIIENNGSKADLYRRVLTLCT